MQENNLIKSITTHICPNCKKDIFVESLITPPSISSVFTLEEANNAKVSCLERIKTLNIEQDKRDDIVKWINDPEVIFGPNEVEKIISSLLEQ